MFEVKKTLQDSEATIIENSKFDTLRCSYANYECNPWKCHTKIKTYIYIHKGYLKGLSGLYILDILNTKDLGSVASNSKWTIFF